MFIQETKWEVWGEWNRVGVSRSTTYAPSSTLDSNIFRNGTLTFYSSQGSSNFAFASRVQNTIYTIAHNYYFGHPRFVLMSEIVVDDVYQPFYRLGGSGSRDLAVFGDHTTGPMMFFQGRDEDNNGALFFAKGRIHWSVQQQLLPPSATDKGVDGNYFGNSFGVDLASNRVLAVGVPDAEWSALNDGAVIVYESDPKIKTWSRTQTLFASSGYDELGVDTRVYEDTLIAGSLTEVTPAYGVTIFVRGPSRLWTQQQHLRSELLASESMASIDLFEDTIAVGYPGGDYVYSVPNPIGPPTAVPTTNAGYVIIAEPSEVVPGPKGRPKRWSSHQFLTGSHGNNAAFGTALSMYGNLLVVGSGESSGTNIYVFKQQKSYWSLQQSLIGLREPVRYLSAKDAQVAVSSISGTAIVTSTRWWYCVRLYLGDQFGDGWDGAYLEVQQPDGTSERYEPDCAVPNPFIVRFCPKDPTLSGMYKFSIKDAPKAKYRWEILWKVWSEFDKRWINADHTSEIEFYWDSVALALWERGSKRLLPDHPVNCTECPPRPPAKPTPHGRKLADPPTPAPTYELYSDTEWGYLEMSGTDFWFETDFTGVNYYISDLPGKRLITSGTSCRLSGTCWQELPDGDYVLRIGGGLKNSTQPWVTRYNYNWRFCNVQGLGQHELVFKVTNQSTQCRPKYKVSIDHYCQDVLKAYGIFDLQLEVGGITLSSASVLSGDDISLFEIGVKDLISGVTDIRINSVKSFAALDTWDKPYTMFDLTVFVGVGDNGFDGRDVYSVSAFETYAQTLMASRAGRMWSDIVSSASVGSNAYRNSVYVKVVSSTFKGIDFIVPESLNLQNEATFTYLPPAETLDTDIHITDTFLEQDIVTTHDNIPMERLTMLGFGLAGIILIVFAVVGIRKVVVPTVATAADTVSQVVKSVENLDMASVVNKIDCISLPADDDDVDVETGSVCSSQYESESEGSHKDGKKKHKKSKKEKDGSKKEKKEKKEKKDKKKKDLASSL